MKENICTIIGIIGGFFVALLEGASCQQISRGLKRDGTLTARGNKKRYDSAIRRTLENEKYMGDALLQKTYTVDFLKQKRIKNNGDMPQYYIEDNHLREQKEKSMLNDTSRTKYLDRIHALQEFISRQNNELTEFNETLVKHLLERVTVHDKNLVFALKSGVAVEVEN